MRFKYETKWVPESTSSAPVLVPQRLLEWVMSCGHADSWKQTFVAVTLTDVELKGWRFEQCQALAKGECEIRGQPDDEDILDCVEVSRDDKLCLALKNSDTIRKRQPNRLFGCASGYWKLISDTTYVNTYTVIL